MRLYPHGGYLNPAYGAWGVGVAIQLTVALCLLLLAGGDRDGPVQTSDEADRPYRIRYTSTRFFNIMGGLHVVGGAVTAAVVVVGYLIVPLVLCPLTLITILNLCLIFCTAGCCGYILTQVQDLQKMRLQHMRHPELGPLRDIDNSEFWAYHNQTALMYITCLCVAEVPCFLGGLFYSKDSTTGTRATAWFYVSVLMVLSGMVVSLMTGLPKYSAVGIIWFALWALLVAGIGAQQFCLYRVFAVVIGMLFVLSVGYSLLVWIVGATSFTHTKKYTFTWETLTPDNVVSLTSPQYSWLKATLLSNFGQYFMFECVSCASLCLVATFSMLYAFYSVCTKKPPAAGKTKKDAAEEAHHADEEVGLKQEEPATADAAELLPEATT